MEYEKSKVINAPKDIMRSEYTLCLIFKARLVADGHLPKEPTETVYSGVVLLRNLRLAMFLAELNNLQEQMLEMHTSKHSQNKSSTLYLTQNLKSYKDMFLLCTRYSMVQDLEEHVGMTSSLIFFNRS